MIPWLGVGYGNNRAPYWLQVPSTENHMIRATGEQVELPWLPLDQLRLKAIRSKGRSLCRALGTAWNRHCQTAYVASG